MRRDDWDGLSASTGSREVFRYRKADRTRTYQLNVLATRAAELWVVTDGGGQEKKSRRLMTLTDLKEVVPILESIEQELRTGGWSEV